MGRKNRQPNAPRPLPSAFSVAPPDIKVKQAAAAHSAGQLSVARLLYREVLQTRPRDFDALHMLGVIALQTGDYEAAAPLLEQALSLEPEHPRALANMGSACVYLGRPEEALRHYDRAVLADPRFAGVLNNRGNTQQLLGRHGDAIDSFSRLVTLAPAFDFARGNLFQARRHCCDWRDFDQQVEAITAGIDAGKRVDRPFSFLSVSGSAERQLRCAKIYASYLTPAAHAPLWKGERYGHDRIRVAYVSADFRNHVVSNLMAAIYEKHDTTRFQTVGVSLAPEDDSEVVGRAKRSLGQYVDASRLSDDQAARQLREMEIDIAVDLTGYTQGCRPGIFARRPAPAQVNFLGIPGTMGADYIDYIIGDDFVVPESSEGSYAERIVRLPDCFQANDDRRPVLTDAPVPARAAVGLPPTGVVLCSFNNSYKLNPACFDIWVRVLRQVPQSVLWLIATDDSIRSHLRDAAAAHGVAAERLIFAPRVPYSEHISRLRLADLFLDTLPFNAGATASDSLWAGVPILTCAGQAFASRMAGSLLHAAGLPDLITFDEAQYERTAVELASAPAKLATLKARLLANQASSPLFDINRYCRNLEAAYVHMCRRVARAEPPASFNVAATQL